MKVYLIKRPLDKDGALRNKRALKVTDDNDNTILTTGWRPIEEAISAQLEFEEGQAQYYQEEIARLKTNMERHLDIATALRTAFNNQKLGIEIPEIEQE